MDLKDTLSSYKILYCEDRRDLKITFDLMMKKITQNTVYAPDGAIGLELFKKEKPDIIITDIDMPNMNGLDMIKEIRKIDSDIPIIITTTHDDQECFLDAIDIGIEKFIIKPIRKDALYSSLEKVVSSLEDKRLADELRTKIQMEELRTSTKEIVSQFSDVFINPIIIFQNDKIKYANSAFEELAGPENMKLILDQNYIDILFEDKEGFCTMLYEIDFESSQNNIVAVFASNNKRKIFQVIAKRVYFKNEDDESLVYTFQDVTMIEYQKMKIEHYSMRLESYLVRTKYKKNTEEKIVKKVIKVEASSGNVEASSEKVVNQRVLDKKEATILKKSHTDKTTAIEFMANVNPYTLGDVDELSENEEDIMMYLFSFTTESTIEILMKIVSELNNYIFTIKRLGEFNDLAEALTSTGNTLLDVDELDDKKSRLINLYLENIFYDLKKWRETIFIKQDTEDIHYLDSSLFSSCLQLELNLTDSEVEDEDDFELF